LARRDYYDVIIPQYADLVRDSGLHAPITVVGSYDSFLDLSEAKVQELLPKFLKDRCDGIAIQFTDGGARVLPYSSQASFETGVLDAVVEGGGEGLWLGDLPALLECDETPPAWPVTASDDARRAARQRLEALGPRPYLAVTWRAGTDTARGREFGMERSSLTKALPPAELGAALRGWPGTIIALQRGARPGEAAQFGAPFHDLSFLGDDLPALVGVLAELDEYVTVSNTNVHLLAGLGRTARVLVPFPAEWRWMRQEGASPWFPGFPVYRQTQSRDWGAALHQLSQDLRHV